jgi:hypothetical protein
MMLRVADYPAFEVRVLRNHNSDVQSYSVRAQMLFQRHAYLPGVVERMTGLALMIDSTTFGLRSRAQTTMYVLDRALGNLKQIQEDFENAHDRNEQHEMSREMEDELQEVFVAIAQQTRELKALQVDLGARYDKSASAQWIATLEQDRAFAQDQKIKAEARRAELDSQMKSVADAIELIERNGVENIGQQAQLTVDNLMAMGMAPPQVQIALLAMDTLKKTLSGIAETISYLNMVAGYNRLRDRARQLRLEAEAYTRDITLILGKVELVQTLDALDGGRGRFLKEYLNIVAAFEHFAGVFEPQKSQPVEARVRTACDLIPGMINHLRPLRG